MIAAATAAVIAALEADGPLMQLASEIAEGEPVGGVRPHVEVRYVAEREASSTMGRRRAQVVFSAVAVDEEPTGRYRERVNAMARRIEAVLIANSLAPDGYRVMAVDRVDALAFREAKGQTYRHVNGARYRLWLEGA